MSEDQQAGVALPDIDELNIGGRTFVTPHHGDITFQQYAYIQRGASRAGLAHEMMATLAPILESANAGDEANEIELMRLIERVVVRAFEDDSFLDLLAGMLVEKGKPWTRESAEENRLVFAQAKGDEIMQLHTCLVYAIVSFFASGLASTKTSLKYSSPLGHPVRTRPKNPAGAIATETSGT